MGVAAAGPAAPLLAGGPPGWLAYGVIVVGGGIAGYLLYDELTDDDAPAVPNTTTNTDTQTRECDRPWTCRVHAQGTDCGGTTGSTIGAPPIIKPSAPVTIAEGLALSAATFAMLNRRQAAVRVQAKARADRYIQNRPPLNTQRSFPASDRRGGKRYDVDNYGCTPNFLA